MKCEVKTKEVEIKTWIADDGREFKTESECRWYERNLKRGKYIEQAEKLRIPELDDTIPLDGQALPSENNNYRWYKVGSIEDIEVLEGAYGEKLVDISSFPEIVCIEYNGGEDYCGDAYSYSLHDIMLETKDFFEKVGMKVEFKELEYNLVLLVDDGTYYDYDGTDVAVREAVKKATEEVEEGMSKSEHFYKVVAASCRDKGVSVLPNGLYLFNDLDLVSEYYD